YNRRTTLDSALPARRESNSERLTPILHLESNGLFPTSHQHVAENYRSSIIEGGNIMPTTPTKIHWQSLPAAKSGQFRIGGGLTINRLGYGCLRLTGKGIWGPPKDRNEAIRVLRRAVELGINFIDTADSYGPAVAEEIIAEALY